MLLASSFGHVIAFVIIFDLFLPSYPVSGLLPSSVSPESRASPSLRKTVNHGEGASNTNQSPRFDHDPMCVKF